MLLVGWKLQNKHVLVIGGGEVAKGRVEAAVKAGGLVTVIAPEVVTEIEDLESTMQLNRVERRDVDLETDFVVDPLAEIEQDYDMVFSAIDDRELSHKIYLECKKRKIPVNVADIPDECDFYFGSVIEKGPLQVMVSTGGAAPRLARKVRVGIENQLDELNIEKAIYNVGKLRKMLREHTTGTDEISGKETGYDKNTITTRMKWISDICDRYNFNELADLSETDLELMLAKYPAPVREEPDKETQSSEKEASL
ncbi:bifunctional precorrin-2 dehydrogenase/sirohydrochlorin ferrochelatase MET8 [Sugiyamaella lignohabitans]|uniref:precorrin-2 dehydrogenase n=1 Tax=Sugiyamaella lignohabitans TaxID=796027 RepID=A0A167CD68_9ASCO|nr:bifunctional precorrin-2 dehydrogenase/sirohydrochlorin ferrochelatase MET8 [Sugiyamaella lignohabitans]ANB11535.1 bifunctional precorrin-2 dehydrogenase/sirohydrochlorin ferrochelatase MET8 [Sugiyamaella lignohabitans]